MERRPVESAEHRAGRWWTPAEDEAMRARWPLGGHARVELAAELGRPMGALRLRAWRLGLASRRAARAWTAEEDQVVRELYGSRTADAIGRRLRRSPEAVRHRAKRLGLVLTRWTEDDDDRLLRLVETRPIAQVARIMGRSRTCVSARVAALGTTIRVARTTLNASEVAMLLGRSPQVVRRWLRDGDLRGEQGGDGSEWLVPTSAVRDFARRFPTEVAPRRTECGADLVRLLVGRL